MPQTEADTRARIVSAAVQVFSKTGFDVGTIREITEIAEVNIAAVNYHFRSKEELIKYVLVNAVQSILDVRMGSLANCVDRARPNPPTVDALAEALVRPLVELGSGEFHEVMKLLRHATTTGLDYVIRVVEEQFAPLHEQFVDVMQTSLPDLSRTEIALRYDCARGAVLQTLVTLAPAATLVSGTVRASSTNHELTIARLVRFVAAGMNAAAA
ncbi:MAG: TetR/AcrR family transcriptional regulator [Pseudomonadota bacterium]